MQAAAAPAPARQATRIVAMVRFNKAFLLAPICDAGACIEVPEAFASAPSGKCVARPHCKLVHLLFTLGHIRKRRQCPRGS